MPDSAALFLVAKCLIHHKLLSRLQVMVGRTHGLVTIDQMLREDTHTDRAMHPRKSKIIRSTMCRCSIIRTVIITSVQPRVPRRGVPVVGT